MSDQIPTQEAVAPSHNPVNPLLAKVSNHIPPVIRKLPSQGLLYMDGELDTGVSNGEVRIYPFTTDDELQLKSPDLLFNGDAIVNVIRKRVPQVNDPSNLFMKDVDFIMLVLRITSYGQFMEVEYKHDCEGAKNNSYSIDLERTLRNAKMIESSQISETYNLKLPTGQVVSFRPMRLKHLVKLLQSSDEDLSLEEQKDRIYEALMMLIHDVDGITNPAHIKEWLSSINPKWVRDIRDKVEESSDWGPVFSQEITCKDCQEAIDYPISTNPLVFFT